MALYLGRVGTGEDVNNLIPQMPSTFFGRVLLCLFFVIILGALSSTADSDFSALSSILMADLYGQNVAKKPHPTTMLLIGRITMIVATAAALIVALPSSSPSAFPGSRWTGSPEFCSTSCQSPESAVFQDRRHSDFSG